MSLAVEPSAEARDRSTWNLSWLRALGRPADQPWSSLLILFSLCGLLFVYGLNTGELWRTESLRAILAAEFLESGNWVVPTLYGNPLLTKPPGAYAAIALVSGPFGVFRNGVARLVCAFGSRRARPARCLG